MSEVRVSAGDRTDEEVDQSVAELDPVTAEIIKKKDREIRNLNKQSEDNQTYYRTQLDDVDKRHERNLAEIEARYSGRKPFLHIYLLCIVSGWLGGFSLTTYAILRFAWHRLTSGEAVPLAAIGIIAMLICLITSGVEGTAK